jgi:hypothetical protein
VGHLEKIAGVNLSRQERPILGETAVGAHAARSVPQKGARRAENARGLERLSLGALLVAGHAPGTSSGRLRWVGERDAKEAEQGFPVGRREIEPPDVGVLVGHLEPEAAATPLVEEVDHRLEGRESAVVKVGSGPVDIP